MRTARISDSRRGTPDGRIPSADSGRVLSQERLGGLHHRYDRAAYPQLLADWEALTPTGNSGFEFFCVQMKRCAPPRALRPWVSRHPKPRICDGHRGDRYPKRVSKAFAAPEISAGMTRRYLRMPSFLVRFFPLSAKKIRPRRGEVRFGIWQWFRAETQ